MKKQPKKHSMKHKLIVGLIDSDGSFSARLTMKEGTPEIGVSVNCTFGQTVKASEIVYETAGALDTNVCETGGKAKVEIAFNTKKASDPKKKLLKILEKNPPLSPGKRRDYLIVRTINQIANTWAQKRHNQEDFPRLKELNLAKDSSRKVGSAAIVFLRFQMTNESSTVSNTKKSQHSMADYLNHLELSAKERELGLELGNTLFEEILFEEKKLRSYLMSDKCRVPIPYIVGFYIGDGSLMVTPSLKDQSNLSITPYFTLIEGSESKEILHGIQTTLARLAGKNKPLGTISPNTGPTFKLKIEGWENCSKSIIKILSKFPLPRVKLQSFKKFSRICEMGLRGDHLLPTGFNYMVDLIYTLHQYFINYETHVEYQEPVERPVSRKQLLSDAVVYFQTRNPTHPGFVRNTLHANLLAKHGSKLKKFKK